MKSVNPPVAGALASASLTTRFALYSFLCIGAMTVALWFLVSNYLINQILEHEWQSTAQIVRADVRKFLEAYDFKAQDRKAVGPKFAALSEHMRLAPDIVRFKVYSPTAVVLWADDKRLVGKSFSENPQLQQALRGKVVADRSASVGQFRPTSKICWTCVHTAGEKCLSKAKTWWARLISPTVDCREG